MKTSADIANVIVDMGLEKPMECILNNQVTNLCDCEGSSCLIMLAHGIYDTLSQDERLDCRYGAAEVEIDVFEDQAAYIKQLSSYILELYDTRIHDAMDHIQHWNTSANQEMHDALRAGS